MEKPYPNDEFGRKTMVMGGGCDSVGVSGCWLGGCFGHFTRKFGSGAVNMLQANVVLANGTLVTVSETSYPDIFWTLRGGGGGNIAIVTEFVARTHPSPLYTIGSGFTGKAKDETGLKTLMKRVLQALVDTSTWPLEQQCTSSSPRWNLTGGS